MSPGRFALLRFCLFTAIGCFVLSLLLPAVNMQVMGRPDDVYGWQAWLLSLMAAPEMLADLHADGLSGFMLLPFAAVLNLNFVAAGIWLYRVRKPAKLSARLAWGALLGVSLALPTPLVFDASRLPGFYVWIAAHCLVLPAAALSWRKAAGGATGS